MGRRESCDVPLPFPNVSGKHCQLSFQDGYWYIRDLGSTNGTKVNGTPLANSQNKVLRSGDEISIARRRYRISYAQPIGDHALDDILDPEEVMSQPLLEKAGLENPRRRPPAQKRYDPNTYVPEPDEDR
jgi:pSer/pThr/pTyr-binding forkhead associated (FHA) protein